MTRRRDSLTTLCSYILQEFDFHELQKICMILKEDGDPISCGGKNVTKEKLSRSLCKYYKPEMYGLFLDSFETDVGVKAQYNPVYVEFKASDDEQAMLLAAMMAQKVNGNVVLEILT